MAFSRQVSVQKTYKLGGGGEGIETDMEDIGELCGPRHRRQYNTLPIPKRRGFEPGVEG